MKIESEIAPRVLLLVQRHMLDVAGEESDRARVLCSFLGVAKERFQISSSEVIKIVVKSYFRHVIESEITDEQEELVKEFDLKRFIGSSEKFKLQRSSDLDKFFSCVRREFNEFQVLSFERDGRRYAIWLDVSVEGHPLELCFYGSLGLSRLRANISDIRGDNLLECDLGALFLDRGYSDSNIIGEFLRNAKCLSSLLRKQLYFVGAG